MRFVLENSKNKAINEIPENHFGAERLKENEKIHDDFEDCEKVKPKNADSGKNKFETLEDAEQNYDDCKSKFDEIKEGNSGLNENDDLGENDEFNDCGKEIEGEYVAEVTYVADLESDDKEIEQELQKAYDECDNPEDMNQLKSNANMNENVEVIHSELVERPKESSEPEVLQVASDNIEEDPKEIEEEIKEAEDDLKEAEVELKEVEEEQNKDVEDQKETEIVLEIENEFEVNAVNSQEIVENETEDAKGTKIEGTENRYEEDDVQHVMSLEELDAKQYLNKDYLDQAKKEYEQLEEDSENMFNVVLKETKGTDSYKQALQEYNDSKYRKDELKDKISRAEKEQTELKTKKIKLREEQLEDGEMAMKSSEYSIAVSNSLQERFDDVFYGKASFDDLKAIQNQNCSLMKDMTAERDSVQLAMKAKMSEMKDFLFDNNLTKYKAKENKQYQKLVSEYTSLDFTYEKLNYNIVKLDDNNVKIAEATDTEYKSVLNKKENLAPKVKEGRVELLENERGFEYKEVFEERKLQEVKNHVNQVYENARRIAEHIKVFDTYKEHYVIDGGHIEKDHDKTLQASDVLEKLFKEDSYKGIYSEIIDRKSLEVMALYHDTGMDGNMDGNEEDLRFEGDEFGSQLRKEHAMQSAIHVLKDREYVKSLGVNADRVALGCLAHSKTYSGVENLADDSSWKNVIDKLKDAVDYYNKSHPKEQIDFDDSFLNNTEGTFDSKRIAEMRSEALCLRIGDANGHDSKSNISQNGKEIKINLKEWDELRNNMPENLKSIIAKGECSRFKDEVQCACVSIDGKILDNSNDPEGFARMFAVGEGNFKNAYLEMVDGMPSQKFDLENCDAYPLSTQYCILERIKEFNTAKIKPSMKCDRPLGMSESGFAKYKRAQEDSLQKIDFRVEIDISKGSKETVDSYEAFADMVYNRYGINVNLKR